MTCPCREALEQIAKGSDSRWARNTAREALAKPCGCEDDPSEVEQVGETAVDSRIERSAREECLHLDRPIRPALNSSPSAGVRGMRS